MSKKIINNLGELKGVQFSEGNEDQNPDTFAPEQKQDFVDRAYSRYCENRKKKAEKKANKQAKAKKFTTGKKIIAGTAAVAIIGILGKIVYNMAQNADLYCDAEGNEEDQDDAIESDETNDIQTEDAETESAD